MITPKRILKARMDLGETQAQFAKRFGVDQSTVHRWETGGISDRGTTAYAVTRVVLEIEAQLAANA